MTPFCMLFAGLGSTNKSATSLLLLSDSRSVLATLFSPPFFLLPQTLWQIWQELSSLSFCFIKLHWCSRVSGFRFEIIGSYQARFFQQTACGHPLEADCILHKRAIWSKQSTPTLFILCSRNRSDMIFGQLWWS